MNKELNIFNPKNTDINNSNSFTELRISTLQEPILENIDIENINPNIDNKNNTHQNDLYQSKSDSKNSLFSSEIKITYRPELFQEIENNNFEKVSEILNRDISQLNEYNIDGYTPLHLSVINGNINIVKLLLQKGANPNALSLSKNQTPLHFSYLNQNENTDEIIRNLINHGAKPNILDVNNKKPSDYLNININTSNSNLNSNNSIQKKICLNKKKEENNLKLNNDMRKSNNSNCMSGSQNSDKNISETNSYETTIINSVSTQKEKKSNKSNEGYIKTSLDSQKKFNINLNELITPIKYPCLANLKEESQKDEKSSINDSLDIENISINLNNNKNNENNLLSLQENDIKNYKSIQSNTSYNDNVDLTYTTSIIAEKSNNKKNSNKKENIKSNPNTEDKKLIDNNNINKNINENSENSNIDEIYKNIIMKKRDSIAKTYKKNTNKIYLYCNHGKSAKNKNRKISFKNNNNIYNNDFNTCKNVTIIHNTNLTNRDLNFSNKTFNKTMLEYSPFSTDTQTGKININQKDKNNITVIEKKTSVTEFKYDNSISEEEYNKNEHLTSLANECVNKSNNLKTIDDQINNNYIAMQKWLSSIELQNYYDNFIKNDIYDINQLISRMKVYQTKLNIHDIESLKIDKKGYCYRILIKLEIDAGLIDKKITKFMINNINVNNNNANKNKNNLKLSISQDYNNCYGCCKFNFLNSPKKNDLKCFLLRYGLMDLYQNFYHNGFDLINYVILQMYSDNPINEDILENCFHIYNYEKRNTVLKALLIEMRKINYFLDSNEYNDNPNKDLIKYENIIFDEKQEKTNIYGQNKNMCKDCLIF